MLALLIVQYFLASVGGRTGNIENEASSTVEIKTTMLLSIVIKKKKEKEEKRSNYTGEGEGEEQQLPLPLPPGTMGWPYIGETFQLYSQNPNVFFGSKQKKYGPIFKTHVLGCPCIMISSPEAAKFVLVNRAHLFKPTFPASKERILGPQALFFHQGDYHAKLRKLVSRAFMPDSLKHMYAFNVALLSIFGKDETQYGEELKRCYYILEKGYNSMPINLPGTLFRNSMKARKELAGILAKIILSRRQRKEEEEEEDYNDLLGSFMARETTPSPSPSPSPTNKSLITSLASYLQLETPRPASSPGYSSSWGRIPAFLKQSRCDEGLSWADTKKMPVTSRVIQETLRVASILSFTFREAVEDVEYQGYLIPKGWKVLPLFRNIHHSPEIFTDPDKFDPSRFEVESDGATEWHSIRSISSSHQWIAHQIVAQAYLVIITTYLPTYLPTYLINNAYTTACLYITH
ncbi:hypothetical protein Sjap_003979 [Stephania japonica]|uniref:Cytochrome P450 n=1 Tax=Stephania japonica TaxID=461633 RepID=A0AAP0K1G1_9MAGN